MELTEYYIQICMSLCVIQETPKVDGLACSFLLSNPDLLVYDSFYDSLVTLLAAGAQRDKLMGSAWTALDAACVRYHFNICWRLLGCLPPSAGFLRQLELGQPPRLVDGPLLLHTMRWAPRLPHKAFQVSTGHDQLMGTSGVSHLSVNLANITL
jgi:E3 ubiquitin-protein ligase UBR4